MGKAGTASRISRTRGRKRGSVAADSDMVAESLNHARNTHVYAPARRSSSDFCEINMGKLHRAKH